MTSFVDNVVKFLTDWSFRLAVIISLVAHVYLILFAGIRRCRPFGFPGLLRAFLWMSYHVTDWAPGYVLGNLYLADKNCDNLIVAFWVPFLLLNIRPDNISAYASEDNKLSSREIVSFLLQLAGAIYVLCRQDITGTTGTFRTASIIMYVYGIAKYLENLLALRQGGLKRIQKRFEKQQQKKKQSKSFCPGDRERTEGTLCYQKARLIAHDLLLIPVGDGVHHRSISSYGRSREIVMVVEMELQLLYELIYTKTAMVFTWHGYLLRLASPFLTTTALVLFSIQCREGLNTKNVIITFALLITTLVLDLMWLVITLGSTWTYAYLKDKPGHWLHAQVNYGGRWHQLRRILVSLDPCRLFVMEPRRYRSWPDKNEQLSMLKMGSTGMTAQEEIDNQKNNKAIPRACRQESHKLMEEAKDLLFSRIWESFKSAKLTGPQGTPAKEPGLLRRRRVRPLGEALSFGPEIQEVMLSWHMATEMFLLFSIKSDQASKPVLVYEKAVTTLSNHLIFLAAERPEMLPGLEVDRLFQSTKHTLQMVWGKKLDKPSATRQRDLADILREIGKKHRRKQVISPCNNWIYQCHCMQENNCNWGCQCHCHAVQENPCSWTHQCHCHTVPENPYNGWSHQCHCHTVQENPCNWSHQCRCNGSCQCDEKKPPKKKDDCQDQELNGTILDGPTVSAKTRRIILDGISFCEALIHVAKFGEEDMSACLNKMGETTKDRFLKLMPEFGVGNTLGGKLDKPVILDLMFDTWVRMVIHAALLCSKDSHEKQLSRGSEFLTTIWILKEHADIEDHID